MKVKILLLGFMLFGSQVFAENTLNHDIKCGLSCKYGKAHLKLEDSTEAEYGLNTATYKGFSGELIHTDTLDKQWLRKDLLKHDDFKIRTSLEFTEWADTQWMAGVVIKFNGGKRISQFSYDANPNTFTSRLKLGYIVHKTDKIDITPVWEYLISSNVTNLQFTLECNIIL